MPLDTFREGYGLYRQAVADLAYARMRYPNQPVVLELEQLVGQGHSLLYQVGKARSRNWTRFWRVTWPSRIREAAGPILLATGLFWVGTIIGAGLTLANPVLEGYFVSPEMREAISSGHLWTESLTRTAPVSGSDIATNNLRVSLIAWALGLGLGVVTAWLMLFNGLMLGAISAACFHAGMLGRLLEFVVGHGSLELPAIWISGGAGLLIARSMILPGRHDRSTEFRLACRRSVEIMVGVLPLLLIAGVVEAFISPGDLPGSLKALLGLILALTLLAYIALSGRHEPIAERE